MVSMVIAVAVLLALGAILTAPAMAAAVLMVAALAALTAAAPPPAKKYVATMMRTRLESWWIRHVGAIHGWW